MDKTCAKCGTADRYSNGRCKQCQKNHVKAYRSRERGDSAKHTPVTVPKPTPVVPPRPSTPPPPEIDLADELSSGKKRLAFMVRRHQQTLNDLDTEMRRLDECLAAATLSTEQRFYTSERRKLLEARMAHDQRLSKEIAAFQELVAKDDTETPITFVHVGLPPREWVETGCIGDTLDLSDYMPERADDVPDSLAPGAAPGG